LVSLTLDFLFHQKNNMKQLILIAFLFLAMFHLKAQDFSKVEVKLESIRGNVSVLFGSGGNIGVLSGPDGIVLVDNQFAPLAGKIKAALAEVSASSIAYTINTHFHYDHADGNKAYGPEGALIVAHENTRSRLLNDNWISGGSIDSTLQERYPSQAIPKITFEQSTALHLNGEDLQLLHIPNAHTDTDLIVFFKSANVIHTGDVFVRYGIPFVDAGNGGSVAGIIKGVNTILELCDEETKIIPGHGQVASKSDVLAYRDMLQDIWDSVKVEVKKGKTLSEILENDPTQKYQKGNMGAFVVELIYKEINQ